MTHPRTFIYETTIAFGADGDPRYCEMDVKVSYAVVWGSPERGNFGPPESYDPGSPDEIEDVTVLEIDGRPKPWDLSLGFASNEEVEAAIIARVALPEHVERMLELAVDTLS